MSLLTPETLAAAIDQTLLRPTVSLREGEQWLAGQRECGFAAVCVPPALADLAVAAMRGSGTAVCSVVGFPLGYDVTAAKAFEAAWLVTLGCREIDVVVRVGDLMAGDDETVRADIAAVVDAVRSASGATAPGLVKVILETAYLDASAIISGCRLAEEAGADFVKTSTGFGPRGASVADVRAMRAAVGDRLGVKAAGGIRTLADAVAMIDAGATRIGTSAGREILAEIADREV